MTPERWQQVKDTLATALEFPDEPGRAAFVRNACGDDTGLRREVESLLAQPDDELEPLAQVIGVTGSGPVLPGDAGRRVGNYELIRELGRGGMGTVWLAQRADRHFEKTVAIKLLKRGTDTDEVLRRFQIERQILARLEHPNIGRLLDGGINDDDLPYFVMEYVEGRPVTDFCREKALTIEDQLRLFVKICGAVQFAHQNLLVHRDLKPANILVTAEGEPKLLDFGIAKQLAPAAGDPRTRTGLRMLTPRYASPEQVRGEAVATASDVYSLGVLLCELLCGRGPYPVPKDAPPYEIECAICDREPERPSEALLRAGEPAPETLAARRGERPATLRRQLAGDLDTIVLKTLRKD